ncbi:MAG: ABC transporter permease subunit, partial [Myxococcota bacterium]|nr:ABC transporter permease subunit [Myxococcota bacterium]
LFRYLFAVVSSLPRFVLVLLVCSIYGAEPHVLAIATGASYAPQLGDAIHSRIMELTQADFVMAARAHGFSNLDIVLRQLLWVNCRHLAARHLLYLFGYYLLLETTLSYIGGFGIEEPQPSWGNMLAFEFGVHDGNLWAILAPALATWFTILAAILAAEGLQERGRG